MSKLCRNSFPISLSLPCPAVFASTQEELLATTTMIIAYAFIAFVIAVAVAVYFMKSRDKRLAPLTSVFEAGEAIHSVAPQTPVTECVRRMTAEKIGALVVLEGDRLTGIFTERDALTRVLAAGLDPGGTKVSEVMTKEPLCVAATTTVGAAMELITKRRFRHLPIMDNGKLLAVVSSGDLTRWLIEDQLQEVRELVLAAQT